MQDAKEKERGEEEAVSLGGTVTTQSTTVSIRNLLLVSKGIMVPLFFELYSLITSQGVG